MVTRRLITSLIGLLTFLTVGCELQTEGGLNPNAPSQIASMLLGTWSSASVDSGSVPSSSFPNAASCTDLEWSITQQNGSDYSGEFSATCSRRYPADRDCYRTLTDDVLHIDASGTSHTSRRRVVPVHVDRNRTSRSSGHPGRVLRKHLYWLDQWDRTARAKLVWRGLSRRKTIVLTFDSLYCHVNHLGDWQTRLCCLDGANPGPSSLGVVV